MTVVINKADWRREDPHGILAVRCPGRRNGRPCRVWGSLEGYNVSTEGFVQPRIHHDLGEEACGFVAHVRLEGWPSVEILGNWREPELADERVGLNPSEEA